MEQTKALNALEPYLALTKSATAPRAAADLVTQATSNPNTYVFAELLQAPQIQALSQTPEYAPYLQLLEIFSHGTYQTYTTAQTSTPSLPPLNDAQVLKLRQLSLLTLARNPHNLTYTNLQTTLGLPSPRAVEELVISAIYAGLIEAQLDPRHQTVHVSGVAPLRDPEPNSIPSALAALRAFSARCETTLQDLENQVTTVRSAAISRATEKQTASQTQAKLLEDQRRADTNASALGAHTRGQNRIIDAAVARLRGGGAASLGVQSRSGKRGSGSLETSQDSDEAMDVDEEDPDEGDVGQGRKQRQSRRKL
ncbi:uncharacterized protein GGS22DRAFT_172432 [Annulohypoxylon maeteangense]|uniref:uncharacterized protein n=1 Tax=Annulohypoxylon maeteangense TaxID=1927788 RepID=UPI0020085455|nr:uncharacterized protein GGS22DRAFT_172432 [Annulohypoxylon maeteangense]KAI0881537.1 hypothetical protein GGS22DRAFT_172432 [Annulohypoxylon maeteangense]